MNGLSVAGRLRPDEEAWRQAAHRWFDDQYRNPADVDPDVFDPTKHPVTSSWFDHRATTLIDRVADHLRVLDAHGVAWVHLVSADPGPTIYRDADQIVVAARHDPARLDDRIEVVRSGPLNVT